MTERIFRNWATTILGLIVIGGGTYMWLGDKINDFGYGSIIGVGTILIWVKNKDAVGFITSLFKKGE